MKYAESNIHNPSRATLSHSDPHVMLYMRPTTLCLPRLQNIHQVKLVSPEQLHENLVQFHQRYRLAQTLHSSTAKDQIIILEHSI